MVIRVILDDPLFVGPWGAKSTLKPDIQTVPMILQGTTRENIAVKLGIRRLLDGAFTMFKESALYEGQLGYISDKAWGAIPAAQAFLQITNIGSGAVTGDEGINNVLGTAKKFGFRTLIVSLIALCISGIGIKIASKVLNDTANALENKNDVGNCDSSRILTIFYQIVISGIKGVFRQTLKSIKRIFSNIFNTWYYTIQGLYALATGNTELRVKIGKEIEEMEVSNPFSLTAFGKYLDSIYEMIEDSWNKKLKTANEYFNAEDQSISGKTIRWMYVMACWVQKAFTPVTAIGGAMGVTWLASAAAPSAAALTVFGVPMLVFAPVFMIIMAGLVAGLGIIDLNKCEHECRIAHESKIAIKKLGHKEEDYTADVSIYDPETIEKTCVILCQNRRRFLWTVQDNRSSYSIANIFSSISPSQYWIKPAFVLTAYTGLKGYNYIYPKAKVRTYYIKGSSDFYKYVLENKLPQLKEEYIEEDKESCAISTEALKNLRE